MFLAGLTRQDARWATSSSLTTGSGKTRVVEAMAEPFRRCPRLYQDRLREFQHSARIAKLIGSPPGYLGIAKRIDADAGSPEPVAHGEA